MLQRPPSLFILPLIVTATLGWVVQCMPVAAAPIEEVDGLFRGHSESGASTSGSSDANSSSSDCDDCSRRKKRSPDDEDQQIQDLGTISDDQLPEVNDENDNIIGYESGQYAGLMTPIWKKNIDIGTTGEFGLNGNASSGLNVSHGERRTDSRR